MGEGENKVYLVRERGHEEGTSVPWAPLSLTLNEAQNITQISHLFSSGLSQTLGPLAQNEGKAFIDFSGDGRLLSVSQQEDMQPSENSFCSALYLHLVLALVNQFSPVCRILAIS